MRACYSSRFGDADRGVCSGDVEKSIERWSSCSHMGDAHTLYSCHHCHHYHVRSNRCSLDVHYAPPVRKKLRLLNERPRLLFGELAPHQPLKPNITIITTTEMLRYYSLGNVIWYFLLSEEDGTWLL